MSEAALRVDRRGTVLEVTLDRPKANAIDAATSRRMGELFAEFRDDPELRVAVLTGAGDRFFCAGWDLKAAAEGGESYESDFGAGGFGGFPELPGLDKPVIAAVNGLAVGGGFEIVLGADLVVAAEHAQFALAEVRVGVLPDAGIVELPRRLPRVIAHELLLTGRRMSAAEAAGYGLVNAVVPGDALLDKARELAAEVVAGAPLAVAAIKDLLRRTEALSAADAFALMRSSASYQRVLESEDAQEGPRAFAEKRPPVWKGR